jgi:signal transduction histidine kinase
VEAILERPDGAHLIVSINAAPLPGADGEIAAVVLALSDISNLDMLSPSLPESDSTLLAGFARLQQLTLRTLDEVRGLSHALRPAILDDVGLVPAIQACCEEWTQTFGIPIELELEPVPGERLPPETETALFRIVQEALMNAGKYAAAAFSAYRCHFHARVCSC